MFGSLCSASSQNRCDIKFLTRDIVGQVIDWNAVYPADKSDQTYQQKIKIHYHFIEKIGEILYTFNYARMFLRHLPNTKVRTQE